MEKIKKINLEDERYPILLKQIRNAPKHLYIMGDETILNNKAIAIIGSRCATHVGIERAKIWAGILSKNGFCINSGMAQGIDSAAHKGALEVNGKTIAVMGTGFGTIFPKENKGLFSKIIENGGAVITEYEENVGISSNRFVARNRIVSGLSLGTLVIEAKYRSGTTITAGFAKEQGRKVFCIPHDINDNAGIGTNFLINKGAKLVSCAEDILGDFGIIDIKKKELEMGVKIREVPLEYKVIYNLLSNNPIHINDICKKSKLEMSNVSYILTMLELEGFIKQLAGKQFILI